MVQCGKPVGQYLFATGQRVFHQKFGYGHVTAVDGNKLEIAFEKAFPQRTNLVAAVIDGQTPEIAEEAAALLPEGEYPRAMYRFVLAQYESGATWEDARDAVYQRYQVDMQDG